MNPQRTAVSYSSVFRLRKTIYTFGNIKLPVGIPQDSLIMLLAAIAAGLAVQTVFPPVRLVPYAGLALTVIGPVMAAWYASRADWEGKGLAPYAAGLWSAFLAPRHMWMGRRRIWRRPGKVRADAALPCWLRGVQAGQELAPLPARGILLPGTRLILSGPTVFRAAAAAGGTRELLLRPLDRGTARTTAGAFAGRARGAAGGGAVIMMDAAGVLHVEQGGGIDG
ncbi:MAG: TcpE family conjugal transfer membrane protein [Thermaerobacter sp.]|jgi:hypothetical protein|nr:TcpE family conjugal transfer membrane protein [Thermaerobacter sp.]